MTMRTVDYTAGRWEYEAPTFGDIVDSMSNWQRSQWARAGYPGLRFKVINDALPFAVKHRRGEV